MENKDLNITQDPNMESTTKSILKEKSNKTEKTDDPAVTVENGRYVIDSSEDENSRASFTFLDYMYKDYAVNDEVMIDKQNAMLWYRKKDGTIVPCTSDNSGDNITEVNNVINNNYSNIEYPSDNCFMINFDVQVPEADLLTENLEPNYSFLVAPASNGFFLKANSRRTDMNFIEILMSLYNKKHNENGLYNAILEYNVKMTTKTDDKKTLSYIKEIRLNQMDYFTLFDALEDSEKEKFAKDNLKILEITITKVSAPKLAEAATYPEATSDVISRYKPSDDKVVISSFTINAFIDDLESQMPQGDNVTVNNIYNNIKNESNMPKVITDLSQMGNASIAFLVNEIVRD